MQPSWWTLELLAAVGMVLMVTDCSADCYGMVERYFDADKYMGLWYQLARFGETNRNDDGKCVSVEYTLAGINRMTVHNMTYSPAEGVFKNKISWLSMDNFNSGEAKLTEHFPDGSVAPYWVLDTDYDSYSIVWNCREDIDGNTFETAWILSRNTSLTEAQKKKVESELTWHGLSWSLFTVTSQGAEQCTVGKCYRPAVYNFDADKYLGVWYEIARFGQIDFENGGRCITVEYALAGINNVTIHNRVYSTDDNTFKDKIGWAKFDDPNAREGQLEVHFGEVKARYVILDTDYESYSIVWACSESESEDETANITEASWILSRTAELTTQQKRQLNDKLEALGLPRSRYTFTPQDPQQCIVTVRTCDKPAASQFNVIQYLGTWYEIARFGEAPLEEGGRCITATYALVDENNVTVYNKMFSPAAGVFNHIMGWAELDDPDSGEAKLTVHFPQVPVTSRYWVLDTDYDSYAIVWACREPTDNKSNITETSWILSRNAQLTEEVERWVTVKLQLLGLPRSRFTDTLQDPQQCVASDHTSDKPAVSEFDTYKYLGTWYEIARFGQAPFEQVGQCVTAHYSLAGENNVTVHNRMFNQEAGIFNDIVGWAELDDLDSGEAKFTMHFPHLPLTVRYWVLDTDYDNYSIVWGFKEPADEQYITERSWILSRTGQLSADIEEQVNEKLEALGLPRCRYTDTPQDPQQCVGAALRESENQGLQASIPLRAHTSADGEKRDA